MATSAEEPIGVQRFVTRPDLRPPTVRVRQVGSGALAETTPTRYIVVSPRADGGLVSQQGLMILDRRGHLIWFQPTGQAPFDLNVQSYQGKAVLTWFQGQVVDVHGVGTGEMADQSYQHLMTIRAGDGLHGDLHELNLTSRGTALLSAFEETTADLSAAGGPRKGTVLVCHAQEIDLASGKVLFDWNSLDHVGVTESYQQAPTTAAAPYDYFHINSISETPDGNLLICCAKNTWALYKVDRATGAVVRLNSEHLEEPKAQIERLLLEARDHPDDDGVWPTVVWSTVDREDRNPLGHSSTPKRKSKTSRRSGGMR